MILFIITITSLNNLAHVRLFIKILLIAGALVVLYGFGQVYLKFPVISTNNKEFSKGLILYLTNGARVNSTFAGHYDLAVFLAIILSISSSIFFYYRSIAVKVGIFLFSLASFALLGLTASRITFFAAIISLGCIFWWCNRKKLVVGLLVISLLVVGLVPDLRHRLVATLTVNLLGGGGPKYTPPEGKVTIYTDFSKYPPDLREKLKKRAEYEATTSSKSAIPKDAVPGEPINSTELGVYRSFGIRTDVEWPRALRAFYKNPFLGTGFSSITLATDNDFLRSLGEVGLLGTLSLALIFLIIIKRMIKFLKYPPSFTRFFIIAMLGSLISLLITGLFIDVLEASKISEFFWLIMGLAWVIMDIQQTSEREEDASSN